MNPCVIWILDHLAIRLPKRRAIVSLPHSGIFAVAMPNAIIEGLVDRIPSFDPSFNLGKTRFYDNSGRFISWVDVSQIKYHRI